MTSRERIEAALRHREPDRTPIFEYVLQSPIADIVLGRPYAADPAHGPRLIKEKGWEPAVRQCAVDIVELAVRLGHDMLYVIPNPPSAGGTDGNLPQFEEFSEDPVAALERRNEAEAKASPEPPDETLLIYEYIREEMPKHEVDLPILAPAYVHGVWTDIELMQTMLLAPDVAHRHFDLATRRGMASIEKYLALGIEQIGVGGDFAGNRPLISPRAYREFIVPRVRRMSQRIHDGGAWAVNASDGDLWSVIDDFLLGCEVDAYLEIDKNAGMDMPRLKSEYGEKIVFYGNLDCGNMLSFSAPEDVQRETLECIEAGMGSGGHVLTASNAITSSVPLENYTAMLNTYRDYFGLPRLNLGS